MMNRRSDVATHLHFDCFSGISGDMTLGALVDAGLPFKDLVRGLALLRIEGFRLTRKRVERGALTATKVDVLVEKGFRAPLTLAQIKRILLKSGLPPVVKEKSQAVFDVLAHAEGKAHGVEPSHVHFHEVGVIDSFVDVVGGVLGLHLLGVQRVTASAINVGSGSPGRGTRDGLRDQCGIGHPHVGTRIVACAGTGRGRAGGRPAYLCRGSGAGTGDSDRSRAGANPGDRIRSLASYAGAPGGVWGRNRRSGALAECVTSVRR
ncbi:MAG: LarC family nickel insertion protein [Nitrospira sp.]|nr:MAG: LarC family nickel insertion protein [Nitrospira sp.]